MQAFGDDDMNNTQCPDDTKLCLRIRCIHCMGEFEASAAACPHCGHPDQSYYPHPLYLSPQTLLQGQYSLGRVLGQGGFGITYIGLDTRLNKRVAIKEYLPSGLALRDPNTGQVIPQRNQAQALQKGLDSFISEARNLAKFDHPNIVRVLNYFSENQTAYMVMEYLEGDNPARRLCERGGRLGIDEALDILLPILDALEVVHAQQVFHLDVSAHNILLTHHEVPVLIDFGAARSVSVIAEYTRSMTLVLKPGYSPLEQYSDQGNIGAWTDIYACAALLYLLLHGQLPPAATERWQQDNLRIALAETDDLRAPVIQAALKTALAVQATRRWQNIAAFRAALIAQPKPAKPRPAFLYSLFAACSIALLTLVWQLDTPPPPTPAITAQAATFPVAVAESNMETSPSLPAPDPLQAAIAYWLRYAKDRSATDFVAAYQSYAAVLQLQPAHPEAQQGLEELAQQRLAQAQNLYQQAQYPAGLALLQQTAEYFPNRRRDLQSLQQNFMQSLAAQAQQEQLEALLAQAEQQLATHKLTTPAGDNAYASYQSLQALAATDPRVKRLPERIAERYAELAEQAQTPSKKHELIQKGLSILPTYAALLDLQKALEQSTPAESSVAASAPVVEIAYVPPPPPQVAAAPRAAEPIPQPDLADWLAQAQQALAQDELEQAYRNYQKILALQPQHSAARQGVQAIASRYATLAHQRQLAGELAESLVLVGRGLGIQAQSPELLQLQQALREQLNTPTPAVQPPPQTPQNHSERLLLTPSF